MADWIARVSVHNAGNGTDGLHRKARDRHHPATMAVLGHADRICTDWLRR